VAGFEPVGDFRESTAWPAPRIEHRVVHLVRAVVNLSIKELGIELRGSPAVCRRNFDMDNRVSRQVGSPFQR
jgi:hypothetical protein